ncbi:metal-dependent hydrolase [Robinsoniella sp. KNHs210]|uniref:metal-dependent hydrolase n=1 Tax=Robinsoniella sp. KNHs210 TaxID=1469950 RepID=UPI00069485E6|nr:metal-dependent hydrolase [Robinsoniella sp. KNHs210]
MTGKTHVALGTAAALLIGQPENIREVVLCIGTASVGSVISDIDVSTSEARRDVNKVIAITLLAVIATVFMEYQWKLGITASFMRNSNLVRLVMGMTAFLGVCIFGKSRPHRSFMHSLPAVGILSFILYIIYPILVPYFIISMLSHIAADIFNYKNVRLLYPLKWGISLDLCRADGLISKVLCGAGSLLTFFYLGVFLWRTGMNFLGGM